jgi:ABC-type sugar transport system substrate-binding protein
MKRKMVLGGFLFLGAAFLFGGAQKDTGGITIGIALSSSDEFNTNLRREYEAYAKTLTGVRLTFTHATSAPGQVTDVENLVSQGVDVLVVRAVDGETVVPAVIAAKAAGVKINIDETNVNGVNWDARISGDQLNHGIILGNYLKDFITRGTIDKARIGYIAGLATENILKRKTGISRVLSSSQHEFVTGGANGYEIAEGWSAAKAQEIVENWITSGQINRMNVIACMNDEIANGAIAALGTRYPNIIVLGVDGSAVGQANIRNGKMKATTYQDSKKSAKAVIETCVKIYKGEAIVFSDSQNKLVNPDNISLMTLETIDGLTGTGR